MRGENDHVLYVFDDEFFHGAAAADLLDVAPVPDPLVIPGEQRQLLTLGGPGAGTQFHTHGPAFLTLLAGRKKWFWYQPGAFPNESAPLLSGDVKAFEATVPALETAGRGPGSCVQHAGDTIYVPDGFAHATSNIDETIGVAWQSYKGASNVCAHGYDYFCVMHQLAAAERAEEFASLIGAIGKLTSPVPPLGALRFLERFWKIDAEGARALFKEQKKIVLKHLRRTRAHTDEAILFASVARLLSDIIFKVGAYGPNWGDLPGGHRKEMMELLSAAVSKAPESSAGTNLAVLYGMQNRWRDAISALQAHLKYFPSDSAAAKMLSEAHKYSAEG
jgi:hypothetical protein